ncbi:MAG: elongation factor P [Kiritimatiellia bacterium]
MYNASDLRKGLKVEIDGEPYMITEFNFVKPGKGQAIYRCKLKSMVTGSTLDKSYRSVDRIDKCNLEERDMIFSHIEGDQYVFMDAESYEQIHVSKEIVGDKKYFLIEDMEVEILFHNERAIEITLPNFVEKVIAHTEPGARGDTANNVLKPAKLDNGYELQVPLFVNEGDLIRVDTRDGSYAGRV